MIGPGRRPPVLARGDVVGGLVLLAIALFAWSTGRGLPFGTLRNPGAGFLPAILSIGLGLLATLIVMRGLRRPRADIRVLWSDRAGVGRVALVAAVLAGGLALMDPLGFTPVCGLICCAMARAGGRGTMVSLAFGAVTALALWLVFMRWLHVNLPAGWLVESLLSG